MRGLLLGVLFAAEAHAGALPFHALNRSAASMTCIAGLAHYYTRTLGIARPGQAIDARLEDDPSTGTISLRNDAGVLMPVVALWCGYDGQDFSTSTSITLPRRAHSVPGSIAVLCHDGKGQLLCTQGP